MKEPAKHFSAESAILTLLVPETDAHELADWSSAEELV
jgi:hypothetical protein